jgi:conjugative relaxase-like TrwC/TraI family protein
MSVPKIASPPLVVESQKNARNKMLRITPSKNAEQAKSYYTKSLSREDYYTEDQELVGRWGGRAAKKLGLKGEVLKHHFSRLVENRHPIWNTQLTARHDPRRRVGYDFNFHCPKSVSVLYALHQDQNILEAFQESVRKTMTDIETEMKTRVRKSGRQDDRVTGNLVYGEFVHYTARPVDGMPDPHLHAHCFVPNVTYDDVEQRWKAGQFGDLKRDAPFYEAVFHARLAKQLRELGYPIDRTSKGWELEGVPLSAVEKFSRRSAEIEQLAKESGITSAAAKDKLGAVTRENKRKGLSMDELRDHWMSNLDDKERDAISYIPNQKGRYVPACKDSENVLHHAISHSYERKSVIRQKELLTSALKYGVGDVSLEEMKRQLARAEVKHQVISKVRQGEVFVTTPEVLVEELAMLDYAREARNTCRPLHKKAAEFPTENLNNNQTRAVRQVLSSSDRVILLQGGAGVGKTTLMRETVRGIEESGKKVYAFAPSAEASRGVMRAEGFTEADTVASLLKNRELHDELKGQVIWIDEAGLVGTKTLRQVFQLAQENEARVLLTGDQQQHKSVERGDAFRLLQDHAGLKPARVSQIMRQQGAYREAVDDLSHGDVVQGFEKLDQLGAIREYDEEERHEQLAFSYLETVGNGKTALVVAPTHQEGEAVTEKIREGLKERYLLEDDKARILATQRNLSWTEAERSDAQRYEAGQIVEFHRSAPGIRSGDRLIVQGVQHGTEASCVMAKNLLGYNVQVPLDKADRFQVFEATGLRVAPGDLLRIRKNGLSEKDRQHDDQRHRLHNGSVFKVKGFTRDGDIRLDNDWVVRKDYRHLSHGYCTTSHAAQGKTVDRVFIAQSAESYPASSQEQFYVSASRGRESVTIFTDNKDDLLRALQRSSERLSATELVEEGQTMLRKPKSKSLLSPSLERALLNAQLDAHNRVIGRHQNRMQEQQARQVNDPRTHHTSTQLGRGKGIGDGRGRSR